MPDPASTPPEAWLAAGFLLLISLAVYGVQVRRIVLDGGKVRADRLDFPAPLMSLVFAGFFTFLTVLAVRHHGKESRAVNIDSVLPNSMIFILFVAGISGFMRFRGLRLRETFGLDRVSPPAVLGWAMGLVLAAFPILLATTAITFYFSRGQLDPQGLVDLFNHVARQHDYSAMGKILVSAVVIQPACEEFLFRGFFYGVWKRYLGPLSAGFFACLLFAAFHANLASFASLFALAACLNIAYERTGSLFVPIGMHALFNLTNLLIMFMQAQIGTAR